MKIDFVCFGFENIGVEYLSACLKERGHQTSLTFHPLLFGTYLFKNKVLQNVLDCKEMLVDRIISKKPDLLAFSVMTDNYAIACEIAKKVKEVARDLPIIFGGVHPTIVPEVVIREPFVDIVCVGEGEEAIVEVAEALKYGRDVTSIPNIWSKANNRVYSNQPRALAKDLDLLPFPDKEIFFSEYPGFNSGIYRINIGRGCRLSCSFCINSAMKSIYGPGEYKKRKRSVKSVIDELWLAKKRYSLAHVLIIDDWFTDDEDWLEDFSYQYRNKIGLSFASDLYPGVPNRRIISLLEEAGCSAVSLGIQTHSEYLRSSVLNIHNSNVTITETVQLLKRTKIFTYVDFIIGIPGQDEQELVDIANFVNKNRADFILFLWLRYYPKMMITDMALKNGWLTEEQEKRIRIADTYISYFDRSSTFQKNSAQLANFLSIILLFPQKIVDIMIKKKFYRYFPKTSFFYFRVMSILIVFIKGVTDKKKGTFYFSLKENIELYLSYIFRIFVYKICRNPLFNKRKLCRNP